MAKEDMDQDEDMDSMENMLNEGHKAHKEHKIHAHSVHHAGHKHHSHEKDKSCCSGGNMAWIVSSIILFVAAVIFMVLWLTKGGDGAVQEKTLTADEIKVEMGKFVNENLIQAGTTASIESVKDVGEAYELIVQYMGQNITSYASKDGKMFYPSGATVDGKLYFPNAYLVEDLTAYTKSQQAAPAQQQPAQTNVPKSEKPNVEVFVMSHCPYGTQIEKGLLPVVELLGNKADIQIKFVNYAMHGQKEIDEQLNQYCIQQEYPDQFYKYLQCFLADGDSERCVGELKFSQTTLDDCISATDEEFGISEAYADKSTWRGSFPSFSIHEAENTKYGVQGSPTLVINGVQVSSSRDSESLKNAICNAFNTAPEECGTALSTAGPSAGFGFGTSGTDAAAAGCGV